MNIFKFIFCCKFIRNLKTIFKMEHSKGSILIKECKSCKNISIEFFKDIDNETKSELNNLITLVNDVGYSKDDLKYFLNMFTKHNTIIKNIMDCR